MIKCIIVEDDPNYSTKLSQLLRKVQHPVEVVSVVQNTDDAISAIRDYNPELVFLDIELGNEKGFELLKKVEKISFEIIFTTAHIDKNIKAIRTVGLSYLPKPVILSELEDAIDKFIQKQGKDDRYDRAASLKKNLEIVGIDDKVIWINDNNSDYIAVQVKNILYCISENQYTHFYIQSNDSVIKRVSSKGIGEWENDLEEFRFCRIHNSHLINLKHISKYTRGEGGTVIMSNGKSLDVSQGRKSKFLKLSGIK